MKEIWKDIKGYEGSYQVSSLGNVKSLINIHENKSETLKKLSVGRGGYLQVALYSNGVRKMHKVHRLVAIAFIPNLKILPQVNHKNGIKTDNTVENLEWVTCKENINHAWKIGLYHITDKQRESSSKIGKRTVYIAQQANKKPVIQLSINNEFIRKWTSLTEVQETTGINYTGIVNCCRNRRKTAGGYKWKYATIM